LPTIFNLDGQEATFLGNNEVYFFLGGGVAKELGFAKRNREIFCQFTSKPFRQFTTNDPL
jgi:hypothetical protein